MEFLIQRHKATQKVLLFALLLLCWFTNASTVYAQEFPALTGRVVDQANILDAATEADLVTQLEEFENATSNQIVVVTVNSLNGYDIADYANKLGRTWEIGTAEHDNGVLLVVSKSDRKVRIEVGYGLEGAVTDAASHDIIRSRILPQFREQDFNGGIQAGVQSIIEAAKGEYVASSKTRSNSHKDGGPPAAVIPLFFFAFIALRGLLWKFNKRQAAEHAFPAGFVGILVTIISGYWLWGLVAGLIMFALLFYFNRNKKYSENKRGYTGNNDRHGRYGGSGGMGGGGGFSGGGGSFGGGGASGSW